MSLMFGDFCRRLAVLLVLLGVGGRAWDARAAFWVTGYYPGYEQQFNLPASDIDFGALTHIIHFSAIPNANGTLNTGDNYLTPANSTSLVTLAHAAGVKALVCVGGAGSENAFLSAVSNNLPVLINSLTNFVVARGYDGVDIDWEPCPTKDFLFYTNLVAGLRAALNNLGPAKLLTVAAGAYPPYGDPPTAEFKMYAAVQNQLDQINIMTYDLSGAYEGWVTWFNSPVFDGNYHFPGTSELVPSINVAMGNFLNNGVAPGKIAISMAFYGDIWTDGTGASASSITQPRQSWINVPTVTAVRYTDIMTGYYQSNLYQWDSNAQAAYLGITNTAATNNVFLSYDDPRACQAKVSFARNNGLGGVMIWELGQDHTAGAPDPLLQAVKQALATPGPSTLQKSGNDLAVAFKTIPLGSYAVQWSSNLTRGTWNTLRTTNISGPGGILQIKDVGVITNQSGRYYRIQTPP
ncbi:MAG TPA: glycoside hydrolase family 18 protein [Verrucomicrobiae bacterium]|nr:glycoside hydrolase family 18 protein [Verrucomicrobiae bacterium]